MAWLQNGTRAVRAVTIGLVMAGAIVLAGSGHADTSRLRDDLSAPLAAHCVDCHNADLAEAGLDLSALGRDLTDPATFAMWERIHDRVQRGEMPPSESATLSPAERATLTTPLGEALASAHAAEKGTVLRRLNRREYQNTLNDLFGTNLDLESQLPEDSRSHEFDNVGSALGISMVQMQSYLDATTQVLDASTIRKPDSDPQSHTARFADTRDGKQFFGKVWLLREDGAVVFFRNFGYPDGMLREASTRDEGWFDIEIGGYAYQSDEPITAEVKAKTYARGVPEPILGYVSFPPGPKTTVTLRAYLKRNFMITVTPMGLYDPDYLIKKNGIEGYQGPGLAIDEITLRGPMVQPNATAGERLLFDGLDRREIPPRNPRDRERPQYVPKYEIVSQNPEHDVVEPLRRVAQAAFRRPVTAEEIGPYLQLFRAERDDGEAIEAAYRTAVTAIFCSPRFLFLQESPGRLDDYALASRLSYFLTRTAPDDLLWSAAAEGRLTRERDVLLAQVDRLLAAPRSERFIRDLADAWLNLREMEFTNPDGQLFPEYDSYLQYSAIEETRAYLRELFEKNLSVKNLVKSDFAMLNERLAEHYGIEGVRGPKIRRVTLPDGSVRGGVLTQASVLKVSANGTNTSPVVRGVYVMERILGEVPPPPPPGIPGVEPDIRGATTLRELLDKHRDSVTCKSCHQMIDPPGFAMECFDPIGGFRDRFRSLGEGERVPGRVKERGIPYRLGRPVDASGVLPDGRTFDGFASFRDHLAANEDALARAFLTKLLTFATGREMGFSDRPVIDRLVESTRTSGHGMRDLLHAAVTSSIFRSK